MDSHALRVIDFPAVLELLAARCDTEQAAASARTQEPSAERTIVQRGLRETGEARRLIDTQVIPSLASLRDVAKAVDAASKGMTLPGEGLFAVYESLAAGRQMHAFLVHRTEPCPLLADRAGLITPLPGLEKRLRDTLEPDGFVKDSASSELARLRTRKNVLANRVGERMQALSNRHREALSDTIVTQRSGRWCLPVRTDHKGKVKGIVHDVSASGQTVFVEPEEIVAIGNEIREVEAAERHEVERILGELSAEVGTHSEEIAANGDACLHLDLIFAKGRLSADLGCVEPELKDTPQLIVRRGRHPLIHADAVVPIDLEIGKSFQCLLITGPNTGGKTAALKFAGLCVAMAQCGMHLPATDASLGVFSQLWADIGDEQSLQQSLSTFSAHLKNIQRMLVGVKSGALVLLDEVGAGTDPAEGSALAKAILSRLVATGACIICTTHYGELKAYAYNTSGIQNAAVEFDVQTLGPTYRLIIGVPGASHALTIAQRFGIPDDVLAEARSGLSEAQQDVAKMMGKLEQARKDAEAALDDALRQAKELKKERMELANKIEEVEERRLKARENVRDEIDEVRRQIRDEADRLFAELKGRKGHDVQDLKEELKALDEVSREFVEEIAPTPIRSPRPTNLKKGDTVKIAGYSQTGRLLADPADGKAHVLVGALKMTVDAADLSVAEVAPPKRLAGKSTRLQLDRAFEISPEVHLRLMPADEAMQKLDRYLDDAVLAGLDTVRVVHGKGTGTLRRLSHEMLRSHGAVKSFRMATITEGGGGVTIAELKR